MRALWLYVFLILAPLRGASAATRDPFSLAISAVQESVMSGRPIIINVAITNTSKTSMPVRFTSPVCDFRFAVLDSRKQPVRSLEDCNAASIMGRNIETEIKPGESLEETAEINLFKDMSRVGDYTIQAEHEIPVGFGKGLVKSNPIHLTVTKIQPFLLTIGVYSEGKFPTIAGGLTVKAGAAVGINIEKKNLSDHDMDCAGAWSRLTGLDDQYRYDVRDFHNHPVKVRRIDEPLREFRGPDNQVCKAGMSEWSGNITLSRRYDLRRPGVYTIQISQPVSEHSEELVKSNIVTFKVTR
jgi:hypothetical protein